MAMIFPKHGQEAAIASLLLSLADNPRDVATNSDSGLAFVVPDYLYQKYLSGGVKDEPEQVTEEIVRRRPGRPRKVQPAKEGD